MSIRTLPKRPYPQHLPFVRRKIRPRPGSGTSSRERLVANGWPAAALVIVSTDHQGVQADGPGVDNTIGDTQTAGIRFGARWLESSRSMKRNRGNHERATRCCATSAGGRKNSRHSPWSNLGCRLRCVCTQVQRKRRGSLDQAVRYIGMGRRGARPVGTTSGFASSRSGDLSSVCPLAESALVTMAFVAGIRALGEVTRALLRKYNSSGNLVCRRRPKAQGRVRTRFTGAKLIWASETGLYVGPASATSRVFRTAYRPTSRILERQATAKLGPGHAYIPIHRRKIRPVVFSCPFPIT